MADTAPTAKRVLIVEDEKPLARALELKLQKAGFETSVAYDGEEASKLLDGTVYDVVILDLVMPKVDGFTVLSKVRSRGTKIPVIVASNLGQPEDIDRAKTMGADEYFVKSSTALTDLVEKVQKLSS